MPPELASVQADGYEVSASAPAGGSEWETYTDDATGQRYMYNHNTGECVWETEQQPLGGTTQMQYGEYGQEQPYEYYEGEVYDEQTGYAQY